jgi:hypothetical protein
MESVNRCFDSKRETCGRKSEALWFDPTYLDLPTFHKYFKVFSMKTRDFSSKDAEV